MLWDLWGADAIGEKCKAVTNFRLSCTWCAADSTAARPLWLLWQNSQHKPLCEVSCCLPPAFWLTSHAGTQRLSFGSKVEGVFILVPVVLHWDMCQIPYNAASEESSILCSLSCWSQAGGTAAGAGSQVPPAAFCGCSNLPVSCPSLPVDDAKARSFWVILRK